MDKNGRWIVLLATIAFLVMTVVACGSSDSLVIIPETPPVGCEAGNTTPDIAVSATDGDDATADGTCGLPYKTITNALSVSASGNVIWVNTGTYDEANGEAFPLVVPAGVSLVGDKANNGGGSTPTLISGKGFLEGSIFNGGLFPEQGSSVSGFSITASGQVAIIVDSVDVTISNSTFTGSYAGINLLGAASSLIEKNAFSTGSYGVWANLSSIFVIQDNSFADLSYGIRTHGSGTIRRNTFTTSGHQGIQVLSDSPGIEDNVFTTSGGYTYAAIRTTSTSSPVLRGNTFTIGTGPVIQVMDTAAPDLGTDPTTDPGNNTFNVTTGADIEQNSTTAIDAMGNTWSDTPPDCIDNIIGTGSVTWGTGGGENCGP